jgi:membrane-bound ClpP family serine protease
MLTLIAIIVLVLLGLALLVAEVIFIPGTTLVGLLGIAFAGLGVFLGFSAYGAGVGLWLLIGTSVVAIASVLLSIRNKSWKNFSLDKSIDSRVNEDDVMVQVGARGVTVSNLRPSGNAEFNGVVFEVRSHGQHLEVGTPVRVSRVEDRTIFVEPLTIYQ